MIATAAVSTKLIYVYIYISIYICTYTSLFHEYIHITIRHTLQKAAARHSNYIHIRTIILSLYYMLLHAIIYASTLIFYLLYYHIWIATAILRLQIVKKKLLFFFGSKRCENWSYCLYWLQTLSSIVVFLWELTLSLGDTPQIWGVSPTFH